MPSRRLLLATAAAILAIAACMGLWATDDEFRPPPACEADPTAAGAAAASRSAVGAADSPVVASAATTDPATSDAAPYATREAFSPTADPDAPWVLVVRGSPPIPAAEAEVCFTTAAEARRRLAARLPEQRYEWPERCGQRTVTDADGRAQLPASRLPYLVCARAPGEFAFRGVPPGGSTTTLTLAPDEAVTIVAADAAGAPLDRAPVEVLQHRRGEKEAQVIWSGHTDADGQVTVRHFQLVRQRPGGPPGSVHFAAALRVLASRPAIEGFVGQPAQTEPVRLRAPAQGTVEVVLTDAQDVPLLSPARVWLTAAVPKKARASWPLPLPAQRAELSKAAGDAPVRLPWIALGARVEVAARFPHEREPTTGLTLAPAPAAGDPDLQPIRRARLRLGDRHVVVAGRLLRQTGEPCTDRRLLGTLWQGGEPVGAVEVTPVTDGRFDLVLSARETGPCVLELQAGSGGNQRPIGCQKTFAMPRGGGRAELGDLVLAELPALCTGQVVDDEGRPVPKSSIRVQRLQTRSRPGRSARKFAPATPQSLPGREAAPAEVWRTLSQLRARTDGEGRFTLYGIFPTGTLRIYATTRHHFADSVPWSYPGQQPQLRLARHAFVRGRVLLPSWLPAEAAALTLRPFEEARRSTETRKVALSRRRGGRFEVGPLRRGRYDAIVNLRGLRRPVLTIPDVFALPGGNADPRLALLDLRSCVHRYRLRATDLVGNPLPAEGPLLLRWQDETGAPVQVTSRWRKGRAEFFAPCPFVEFRSAASGCRPRTVALGPGDHLFAMQRVVPVLVVLPGARALCGADRKVGVVASLVLGKEEPSKLAGVDQRTGRAFSFARGHLGQSAAAELGTSDLVALPIPRDGRYRIALRLHGTQNQRSRQVGLTLGEYALRCDGAVPGPLTVKVDPARVQKALARLRAAPAATVAKGTKAKAAKGKGARTKTDKDKEAKGKAPKGTRPRDPRRSRNERTNAASERGRKRQRP